MKTNIFIPKKIKVGFQERQDTYTKKLAYIVYYDQKDVLRKENSWNSWRDIKIPDLTFDNVPTSGFVLNKKAGGHSSGWNHRQTYVRVYDERDFEFEITIPNLLYILENSNSIKGKGLEGKFVYGWDNKELILIPTSAPDYIQMNQYSEILFQKNHIKVKDLVLGGTYKTKTNEKWIYMGKFDYYKNKYEYNNNKEYEKKNINKGKHHYFVHEGKYGLNTLTLKSLGEKFIAIISTDCVENYADLFDKIECNPCYSPYDISKDKYAQYTFKEFCESLNNRTWFYCYDWQKNHYCINGFYNKTDQWTVLYSDNHNSYMKGTIEEIYNKLQPMYKEEYLKNGKLYRKIKGGL